ncbi:MAG: 5'/3'-nucleotidase SurE [Spirochaetes bacterium]|nr:5'/3'-nucleotidase SurE [Spirochaetota bacterium]
MKILLTNDDGIDSPGLKAIEESLSRKHDVVVVAPEGERSGFSHALSFRKNVIIRKIDKNHYTCSGTPADCVHRALHRIIDGFVPDIVVSGINLGPNLGTDIIYSGTAAAARQAVMMGVPGVAVSATAFFEPFYFENAAIFVADNITSFFENQSPDHFININVPSICAEKLNVMVTKPSKRLYNEKLSHHAEPDGSLDVSLNIINVLHDNRNDTDSYAVENNMISVSPVYVQPFSDEKARLIYKEVFKKESAGEKNC